MGVTAMIDNPSILCRPKLIAGYYCFVSALLVLVLVIDPMRSNRIRESLAPSTRQEQANTSPVTCFAVPLGNLLQDTRNVTISSSTIIH
jgi:hypothetical protein